jgi:hypothetical protein
MTGHRLPLSSSDLYLDQSFTVAKTAFRFRALFAKRPRGPRASSSTDEGDDEDDDDDNDADDDDMGFNADDDNVADGEEDEGTFD